MKKTPILLCLTLLLFFTARGIGLAEDGAGINESIGAIQPDQTVDQCLYNVRKKTLYGNNREYSHSFFHVTEGETYFYTAASSTNTRDFPAGAFYDGKGSFLSAFGNEEASHIYRDKMVTAPPNAVLCVLNRNNGLERVSLRPSRLITETVKPVPYHLEIADRLIELEKKNPFQFASFDQGYVTFFFDDLTPDLDLVAAVFAEYGFPFVIAAIPKDMNHSATGLTNDSGVYSPGLPMWKIMELAAAEGAEIMVHNQPVVTEENQFDYDFMYSYFIQAKRDLEAAGFFPRGIIRAGGSGAIPRSEQIDRWLVGNYEYANMGILPQYGWERTSTAGTPDDVKAAIDSAVLNSTWLKLACHGLDYYHTGEAISDEGRLREILSYVQKKNIPAVTCAYMFDTFGSREQAEQIKELKTNQLWSSVPEHDAGEK